MVVISSRMVCRWKAAKWYPNGVSLLFCQRGGQKSIDPCPKELIRLVKRIRVLETFFFQERFGQVSESLDPHVRVWMQPYFQFHKSMESSHSNCNVMGSSERSKLLSCRWKTFQGLCKELDKAWGHVQDGRVDKRCEWRRWKRKKILLLKRRVRWWRRGGGCLKRKQWGRTRGSPSFRLVHFTDIT